MPTTINLLKRIFSLKDINGKEITKTTIALITEEKSFWNKFVFFIKIFLSKRFFLSNLSPSFQEKQ